MTANEAPIRDDVDPGATPIRAAAFDPLGVQPSPTRGLPTPVVLDEDEEEAIDARLEAARLIWIDHPPHIAIVNGILRYARRTVKRRGMPMEGVRLDGASNAGKSATMERIVLQAAQDLAREGLPANPHLIVYVELDRSTSVRQFYRQVLKALGDAHWNAPRALTDELEDRIAEFTRRLGTILVIGDEIQHLDRSSAEATAVQDKLKTFVNRGLVPLALVGDEKSPAFFKKNPKFAARFETRLRLKPMDFANLAEDRRLLLTFLKNLDAALVACGATASPSGLGTAGIRTPLGIASGGHIGRVARIVRVALAHALSRRSDRIEAYDLSHAVREFAMDKGWIDHDPFSSRPTTNTRRPARADKPTDDADDA